MRILEKKHQQLVAFFLLLVMGLQVVSVYAQAGINPQIHFQGKVVNADGTNVTNASYDFVFSIYSVSSGGTAIWTESKSIAVVDGIFSTNLGSVTALPGSIDFNSNSLYLGVEFNSDNEMEPRIRLTATPYAFNAAKVAGLTVTNTTGTLTIPNGTTISFADAFTTVGANPLTLTTSGTTNVTLPTTGTLATIAGTETLQNKTMSTGSTWNGNLIATLYGGTGADLSSAAIGSLPVFATAGVMSALAPGTNGYVLTSNGAGNALTWEPAAGGSSVWSDLLAPTANLTLSMGTYTSTFNFANTTSTGLTMNFDSLTSGKGLYLAASNSTFTTDGRLFDLNLTTTNTTAGDKIASNINFTNSGVVTTGTDRTYGQYIDVLRSNATGGVINTYGQLISSRAESGTVFGQRVLAESAGITGVTNQNLIGVDAEASAKVEGSYAQVIGIQSRVTNDLATTIASVTGIQSTISTSGAGASASITNATGIYAGIYNNSSSTITNGYGIYIDSADNWGTFTNNYGLYIAEQSDVGSSNSYNLYSAGYEAKNYFEGNVGIGTTNPSSFILELGGNIGPDSNNTRTLGSDTRRWASIHTTQLCLSGDCKTAWPSGGGASWSDLAAPTANLTLSMDTYTSTFNFANTTTSAYSMNFNSLTTGSGLVLGSTSTALSTGSLLKLDWSPGSATTSTGDLFSLNVGANGLVGNLFAVYNNNSPVFRVSQSGITSSVPHMFAAAGDVSIAHNLVFTNSVAAYADFNGPGYVRTVHPSGNYDLTLSAANAGIVLVNDTLGIVTGGGIGSSYSSLAVPTNGLMVEGNVGIGTTNPSSFKLELAGNFGPEANNTRVLGSDTRRWASLHTTELCLSGDCKTAWPSGGGASWSDLAAPTDNLTLSMGTFTSTFNFANTTTTGLTMNFDSLTSGKGLYLAASNSTFTTDSRLFDINLTTTNTTAGTKIASNINFTNSGVVTTGTDNTYGQRINVIRSGSTGGSIFTTGISASAEATRGTVIGGDFYAGSNSTSSNITSISGVKSTAGVPYSGTYTQVFGVNADVSLWNASTVTDAFGVRGFVNNEAGATLTNAYGIYSGIKENGGASATITNGYGVFVSSATKSTGTFTNNYGLYIADQSAVGSTSSYNLYSAGATAKNYFAGNVGIGSLTPAAKLDVVASATTTSTNGMRLDYTQLTNAANITGAAIDITVTPSGDAGDTIRGININNITGTSSTEYALVIGTGWDRGLSVASAAVFGATVTSEGAVTIGSGGNTFVFDPAAGPLYSGTARPTRSFTLSPEYSGATLTDYYGAGTDTDITGAMTADVETLGSSDLRTYYYWESDETILHSYTVAIRVRLPSDFGQWTASNALQISFATENTSSANNAVDARVYLSSNSTTAVATSADNVSGTAGQWSTITIDDSVLDSGSAPEWDGAGQFAVIYLRMRSKDSNYVKIGDITLNYLSRY